MDIETLQTKYVALAPVFTERSRRLWAATEARALGHGGIALVERATGISRSTIQRGMRELESGDTVDPGRTRKPGGGRKRTVDTDKGLVSDLEALVEPTASGDPDSPLRWTTKSVRRLEAELAAMGHTVSHRLVAVILHELGYSLQANRKTLEKAAHPDRDAQFRYINDLVRRYQKQAHPAIYPVQNFADDLVFMLRKTCYVMHDIKYAFYISCNEFPQKPVRFLLRNLKSMSPLHGLS